MTPVGRKRQMLRAVLFGAVAASAWFAVERILFRLPFPLPVYAAPVIGGAGGAVWSLLDRVPLRGRIWHYCRWVLIGSVAYVPFFGEAGPVDIPTALMILVVVLGSGIGLGYYAESFLRKR